LQGKLNLVCWDLQARTVWHWGEHCSAGYRVTATKEICWQGQENWRTKQ